MESTPATGAASNPAGRAALALDAHMAQVREAVAKALEAIDRASGQVVEWTTKFGRPQDAGRNP